MIRSILISNTMKIKLGILFIVLSSFSFAQENKGAIEVFVIDQSSRDSISFASVRLSSDSNSAEVNSQIKSTGVYYFDKIDNHSCKQRPWFHNFFFEYDNPCKQHQVHR